MNPALSWILRLIPAAIVGQTLPFKFGGAEQSKELFTVVAENTLRNGELEAVARLGTGAIELVAVVLILVPKFSIKGALLIAATMSGALLSHALFIGFAGQNGPLAGMAVVALISSATYAFLRLRRSCSAPMLAGNTAQEN